MSEYIIECEYDFDDGWIPGEQREEVVRCRDCKTAMKMELPEDKLMEMAEAYKECDWDKLDWLCKVAEQSEYDTEGLEEKLFNLQRMPFGYCYLGVEPDGYCAWGVRE